MAGNFPVVNSPNLGSTTAFRGTPDQALLMNSMSPTFNTRLESQLNTLATSNLKVNIGRLQLDDAIKILIA